jgi:hypothetical protein
MQPKAEALGHNAELSYARHGPLKTLFHDCRFHNLLERPLLNRIQHPLLLQIIRDRILREQRCPQPDFRADPFPFRVHRASCVVTQATAAKFMPKLRALDLVELPQVAPCLISHRSRNVDFEPHHRHDDQGVNRWYSMK